MYAKYTNIIGYIVLKDPQSSMEYAALLCNNPDVGVGLVISDCVVSCKSTATARPPHPSCPTTGPAPIA